LNVERTQPLRKGTPSGGVNVLPNVKHILIITYTLASSLDLGTGTDRQAIVVT
jgi:hypothetical protein